MSILLETQKLTKAFGGVLANNEIDIKITNGAITALIGPNGSGKTTFINQISGVMKPSSGSIIFGGQDITKLEGYRYARLGIARTFQRINLFNSLSVVENVLTARLKFFTSSFFDIFFTTSRLKKEEEKQYEYSMQLLKLLGLEKEAFECPTSLPYGKRRVLEIARALALEPKLLLLDEPAAGMTKDEFNDVMRIMLLLKERGITMLLVEHTMEFVRGVSDWVYVLNFGRVICEGKFEDIEKDPTVIEAYLGEEDVQ